jgi:hypothetical protein
MCTIKDALKYISGKKEDLPLPRLIQLLYLADWKSLIDSEKQITDVQWQIKNSEPIMDEDSILRVANFFKEEIKSNPLTVLIGKFTDPKVKLNVHERDILDSVIDIAIKLGDEEFSQLVHSTFPSLNVGENDDVNLPELAKTYNDSFRPSLQRLVKRI